jgi:acylphosphatase
MQDDETAILVRVSGRVQGVSYRVWARDEAGRFGLAGWVRNEADGSVAALLVGPPEQVGHMLAAMRRGPPGASVALLTTEQAPPGSRPAGFAITF